MNPSFISHTSFIEAPSDGATPRILVLGLGDFGERVTEGLIANGPIHAKCVSVSKTRLQLGSVLACRALTTEMDTQSFRIFGASWPMTQNTLMSLPEISPSIINNHLVFIVSALGQETSSSASLALAQASKETGALVFGAVMMPGLEQGSRLCSAVGTLTGMKNVCDTLVVVDRNKVGLHSNMCNVDIDSVACDLVSQLIGGIVETLSTPSVVNMGFREFAGIIRGSGFAILGTGETNASDHPEEAVRNAFSCPLLHVDHDGFTGAYLHIRGDGTLTRAQASKVAELISGRLDLVHGMVFGATVDPSLSESLRVTLMLTGVRSPRLLSAYSGIMNLEHEHTPEWEQEPAANVGSYQLEDF